jgi:hypothetical protein
VLFLTLTLTLPLTLTLTLTLPLPLPLPLTLTRTLTLTYSHIEPSPTQALYERKRVRPPRLVKGMLAEPYLRPALPGNGNGARVSTENCTLG